MCGGISADATCHHRRSKGACKPDRRHHQYCRPIMPQKGENDIARHPSNKQTLRKMQDTAKQLAIAAFRACPGTARNPIDQAKRQHADGRRDPVAMASTQGCCVYDKKRSRCYGDGPSFKEQTRTCRSGLASNPACAGHASRVFMLSAGAARSSFPTCRSSRSALLEMSAMTLFVYRRISGTLYWRRVRFIYNREGSAQASTRSYVILRCV